MTVLDPEVAISVWLVGSNLTDVCLSDRMGTALRRTAESLSVVQAQIATSWVPS